MAFPVASRKHDFVNPPRNYGPTGPVGQVLVATVSPTAQYLNLQLVVNPPPFSLANSLQGQIRPNAPGLTENFITIYADGFDLGVVVGISADDVSGASLTAKGTITASGTYQGATGVVWRIPSGSQERFLMQPGQDKFLGVVGSVTGTIRLYQSSPDNA